MAAFSLPSSSPRLRQVDSFDTLLRTPWADGVNALCWPRSLSGDFGEVVQALVQSEKGIGEGITPLSEERLHGLSLSDAGKTAVSVMLADLSLLRSQGLAPELNCIRAYPREEEPTVVPIDVYSYHADSAPVATDTWLCTYFGAPSEGLPNEEALRKIEVPAIRKNLLALFGGSEGEAFEEFLRENCFDLHYAPKPGAAPYSFGVGHLWRITTDWPGCPVPPCVHRAPENSPGQPPRLLLIS